MLMSWPGMWVCDLARTGRSLWKAGEAVVGVAYFCCRFEDRYHDDHDVIEDLSSCSTMYGFEVSSCF